MLGRNSTFHCVLQKLGTVSWRSLAALFKLRNGFLQIILGFLVEDLKYFPT